jgi:Putative phage tail protein
MGFWFLVLMWATTFVIGDLIRPKPELENAKASGIGDFKFPTATEGRVVPIIWGKVKTEGPNVLWYGDFGKLAATKNVSTGFFSDEDIILGYTYFISIQFGICRGPGVALHRIWIGKALAEYAYTDAGIPSGSNGFIGVLGDNVHYLYQPYKLQGDYYFYGGELDQPVDAYLDAELGDTPAYRGTCYVVFNNDGNKPANIGNQTSVEPWSFEVSRLPDGLGLASHNPGSEEPHLGDINPMNVIYEILTDTNWGLSIPVLQIDTANFREAADTLYDEEHGFSLILDSPREATDLLTEIAKQIDGSLFFNREVSKWQIALARDNYDVGTLDIYDESNIVELTNFARTTWKETTNQVNIKYSDRSKDYQETFAVAQDTANMQMQDGTVSVDISYPGVKYGELASAIAWRELATLSYPLSKIELKVNRSGFKLTPGAVFKLSWIRLGLTEIVYRVSKINYGNIDDGTIVIYAVQDIFAAGTGILADPPGSGWTAPDGDPTVVVAADILTFEAPFQMVSADTYNPNLNPRVWAGARTPGGVTVGFRFYAKISPNRPLITDYTIDAETNVFLLRGTLETAIGSYAASAARPITTQLIRINDLDPDDLSTLANVGSAWSVSSMTNIIYIGGEFIGFEQMTAPSGGVSQLTNIYRGLFNTVPRDHDVGEDIWFVGQTGGSLTQVTMPSGYDEMDLQLRSTNGFIVATEGDTPVTEVAQLTNGWSRPLPPRDPKLNGSYAPANGSFDTDYSTETGFSGDDGLGCSVEVTPRGWRIASILQDATLSLSPITYLDDNPEFDSSIVLDPDGAADATELFNVDSTETPIVYITRNALIIAAGANNPIHGTGNLMVTASHFPDGLSLLAADQDLEFEFTVLTALQSADDLTFGGLTKDVASAAVIFGETGSYTFDIHTALPSSGIVEININSGGWVTLIAAAATTGNSTITASDSVELRFTQYPANDQFFDIVGPTAELGYGVLKAL